MKKLNIYLDVDGVLRGTASPKSDIIELLEYCLAHHPTSTYWLTTHCKHGENRVDRALRGEFPDELVEQIYNTFQPTDWDVLKTDAIDFASDFVWFDDNLLWSEKAMLKKHDALDKFFRMNPRDPSMAQKALEFLTKQK
ncbi:MAG: hypothetical protein ACOX0Z_00475 [Candidatus Nanosyncoccaceae bacterium]|jgi:hypothetical protein